MLLVINDLNFSNYADDSTIYDLGDSIDSVITSLQISAKTLLVAFKWPNANSDKCHFITSTSETLDISW